MQTATATRLATDEDFTGIRDFVKRIGVILCCPSLNGSLDVLMERSDKPSADLQRVWKLPQGPMDPGSELPGLNAERFLRNHCVMPRSNLEVWEAWPVLLTDPLPDTEFHRKRFRETQTRWVAVMVEGRNLVEPDFIHEWFTLGEVTLRCQAFRVRNYTTVLTMLDNYHPPFLQ